MKTKILSFLVFVFSMIFLTGCADSPNDVLEKFGDALEDEDYKTAADCCDHRYFCDHRYLSKTELRKNLREKTPQEIIEIKALIQLCLEIEPEIDGDKAYIGPFSFIEIDDEWKIEDIKK